MHLLLALIHISVSRLLVFFSFSLCSKKNHSIIIIINIMGLVLISILSSDMFIESLFDKFVLALFLSSFLFFCICLYTIELQQLRQVVVAVFVSISINDDDYVKKSVVHFHQLTKPEKNFMSTLLM